MTETEKAPGKNGAAKTALCLLAVLLVGGAIAAVIAISLLRSRRDTLEINAIGCCRAYANAQTIFNSERVQGFGVLKYATPYTLLITCADGNGSPIGIIDSAFAAAQGPDGAPKHGYLFQDMQTIGGQPINWVDDFALCGTPARYSKTG